MANKEHRKSSNRKRLHRIHRHEFMLNELENKALMRYISRYRVTNKSKFIRETLIRAVLRQFEEDSPTLFD
jgi:hypothetical protein